MLCYAFECGVKIIPNYLSLSCVFINDEKTKLLMIGPCAPEFGLLKNPNPLCTVKTHATSYLSERFQLVGYAT